MIAADRRPDYFALCEVELPAMEGHGWAVRKRVITEADAKFAALRAAIKGGRGSVRPGTTTELHRLGGFDTLWMSDTPDERYDHAELFDNAHGEVLVHGLGLGMLIRPLLSNPRVAHLTVVEIDAGLIALIGPFYRERWGDSLEIVCGDALTWKPPAGKRYGAVWHDIWQNICGDNLDDMKKLHRRFGRRCDWQGSWCREECEERA